MKKDDVVVGGTYRMKHSSGFIDAYITHEVKRTKPGYGRFPDRTVTHWKAINQSTGWEIEIKSAAKLHYRVDKATPPAVAFTEHATDTHEG